MPFSFALFLNGFRTLGREEGCCLFGLFEPATSTEMNLTSAPKDY